MPLWRKFLLQMPNAKCSVLNALHPRNLRNLWINTLNLEPRILNPEEIESAALPDNLIIASRRAGANY